MTKIDEPMVAEDYTLRKYIEYLKEQVAETLERIAKLEAKLK